MNFKVQIILILICYKSVSSNNLPSLKQFPKVPPNLARYRYEGNFYPVYSSKIIHPNDIKFQSGKTKPVRYLTPVQLSHQIVHNSNLFDDNNNNNNYDQQQAERVVSAAIDDATGSGYQVAMKVQPLQRVISSGKPQQDIDESGKSHQAKRQLKIDMVSPEMKKMQSLRNHNRQGNKINDLPMGNVPINADTIRRNYHDIFIKYKSPQELVFGHVLSWPELAQKRFEKRGNNHFKGQVIWADKTGGYGEHYWDLAQGAL